MRNILGLFIVSTAFSILVGFSFSDIWLIQQSLWVLAVILIFFKVIKNLDKRKSKIFFILSALYLIIESLIKIWLANAYGGWLVINSLEHFIWSFCFSAIIYYPLLNIFKNHSYLIFSLFLISFVSFSGILIELLEFIPRIELSATNPNYYPDTIRDLFLNIAGAACFVSLNFIRQMVSKSRFE